MDPAYNIDRGNKNVNDDNTDVTHDVVATVTITGLSSVNTLFSTPDLSNDELLVFLYLHL